MSEPLKRCYCNPNECRHPLRGLQPGFVCAVRLDERERIARRAREKADEWDEKGREQHAKGDYETAGRYQRIAYTLRNFATDSLEGAVRGEQP